LKGYIRIIAIITLMAKRVIDVTHVTLKGNSMRVTIPRKVSKELGLTGDDIIVFYEDDGIKIKKMEPEFK
jgi:bifunctional DNA-binding transcriptional regulator/antitoxin component of YhaV-PrlF toxin-antitoxin module